MKNILHSPTLFSYPEVLLLLYLYRHKYLNRAGKLKKLFFISVLYGSNLFQETPSFVSRKLTTKYSSFLAKYAVPINGYCLIKKDHKQYTQFIEQYVNDYKKGLFMQNPFNFFSFSHSWENFVSLIHKNQEKYGDVFLLENQPNLPAIRDLANSVRWPECVFWVLLNEKKVFYKGHPIPFKGFFAQLCLLIFLVQNRGANQKIQTFIQALNEWYKTHKNYLKWENNKNILDNLENYQSEILNKIHRACDTYQTSIDFKITVGEKGLRLYPSSSNSSKST